MKVFRHILPILITLVLASCSAERRLANLLYHHPDLRQDTVLKIDTLIVYTEKEDTTNFTLEDLQQLLQPSDTSKDSSAISSAENVTLSGKSNASISAQTDHCNAIITANADGSFNLIAKQKPDTVHITDTITVTKYYTETRYEDKIVYKMNGFQTIFFWIGIVITIIILTIITIKIIKPFLKTAI